MYCPKCGAELEDGSSFCPVCGTDLKRFNKEQYDNKNNPVYHEGNIPDTPYKSENTSERVASLLHTISRSERIFSMLALILGIFQVVIGIMNLFSYRSLTYESFQQVFGMILDTVPLSLFNAYKLCMYILSVLTIIAGVLGLSFATGSRNVSGRALFMPVGLTQYYRNNGLRIALLVFNILEFSVLGIALYIVVLVFRNKIVKDEDLLGLIELDFYNQHPEAKMAYGGDRGSGHDDPKGPTEGK